MIEADSEVLRLEKRQRGLQRVATAINDLTIYGIYPTNFPKLVVIKKLLVLNLFLSLLLN